MEGRASWLPRTSRNGDHIEMRLSIQLIALPGCLYIISARLSNCALIVKESEGHSEAHTEIAVLNLQKYIFGN